MSTIYEVILIFLFLRSLEHPKVDSDTSRVQNSSLNFGEFGEN